MRVAFVLPGGPRVDTSHLVAVEVLAEPPLSIVSVTGYREAQEPVLDGGGNLVLDGDGIPQMRTVWRPNTEDVYRGGTAYLDPAETQIGLLIQCGLVRVLPAARAKKANK